MKTKREIEKAMKDLSIPGEVTGRGRAWEVELPSELMMDIFIAKVEQVGGYKTGYGAWILSPNHKDAGDFNDRSSRWHY